MKTLPLEKVVIATIADERRAFVAGHLLQPWSLTTPELRDRLHREFPDVADALSPWPKLPQSIGDICARSLTTLGLVESERAQVETGRGRLTQGNAWHATPLTRELRDYFDFGFFISQQFGISLFQVFGYFSGGNLSSTGNRAQILTEIASMTKPDKPVFVMQLPYYETNNHQIEQNHLDGLAGAGLITMIRAQDMPEGQKKQYYWASCEVPTVELAMRIHRRPEQKFLTLMNVLYRETSRDGRCAIHFEAAASASGYHPDAITRTLGKLVSRGLVKPISRNALAEVAITPLGNEFAAEFLIPVTAVCNGAEPAVKAKYLANIRNGAALFRRKRLDNLALVMQRYAAVPKPGYEKR